MDQQQNQGFRPLRLFWIVEQIFNNPNFLSDIITYLGRYINTTGSRTLCNKIGCLRGALKSLPLPPTGYYFQPNGIANIISLSLLSDTHQIVMDIDVESAFYVFNREPEPI